MNQPTGQERTREPNYTDEDITFFMGLYRDHDRAVGALTRLRDHFPTARIIIRSDGDAAPQNRELCRRFGAAYHEEERLFPIENGGAIISRTFELFLERPTRYLLKIDTDTSVFRRFRFLPEEEAIFGTVQYSLQGCKSIQGGCLGVVDAAARTILESGLLEDPRLKDPFPHRRECGYLSRMGRRANRTGLASFDWIVGWAANELGIPLLSFDEVHCKGLVESNVDNSGLEFAVTHPVYFE